MPLTVSSDTGFSGSASATGYSTTGCHPGAWITTRRGRPKTAGRKVTLVLGAAY
ncbi:hypothetical protein HD597_004165 [Nonomuraea thailandensis]|uniref:Uncharacterized protein n=1 Tax=Nonomuraea thailandensis TaxID=1188745 RepID=A0A9X2K2J3_9ACTN|nr:hypothetical protein [Nonomuraea thailandensis]